MRSDVDQGDAMSSLELYLENHLECAKDVYLWTPLVVTYGYLSLTSNFPYLSLPFVDLPYHFLHLTN